MLSVKSFISCRAEVLECWITVDDLAFFLFGDEVMSFSHYPTLFTASTLLILPIGWSFQSQRSTLLLLAEVILGIYLVYSIGMCPYLYRSCSLLQKKSLYRLSALVWIMYFTLLWVGTTDHPNRNFMARKGFCLQSMHYCTVMIQSFVDTKGNNDVLPHLWICMQLTLCELVNHW